MECFIYKGLRVFFGVRMVIFNGVGSGEMLDFSGFCRSGCRSGYFGWIWVKCLGNADFTRGLWMEQMCRSGNRTLVLKM